MAFKKLKYWFDRELAIMLSDKICVVKPDFNRIKFIADIEKGTADLELKDRIEYIADRLFVELGKKYKRDIQVLLQIIGPENKNETGMFTEYYWLMPVAKYVEKYGLNDFDLSMKAIAEITKRNTSEYAIRPYLSNHTDRTIEVMIRWSKDENFHIRRLSCEGVRLRLPWAKKLDIFINDPSRILPILENLKDDKVKYIQKSVANCINDLLKDNVDIGMKLVDNWNENNISKERKWIIKHALRNLLKAKNEWAIGILDSHSER